MIKNPYFRSLLELNPDETSETVETTLFKYRTNVRFPGSTQKLIGSLRILPWFIRLKLDAISIMEVSTKKNSENHDFIIANIMIFIIFIQKKDEQWNREVYFIEQTIIKEAENQRKDDFLVSRIQEYLERNRSTIGRK